MDEWMAGWLEWTDECIVGMVGWINEWMDG